MSNYSPVLEDLPPETMQADYQPTLEDLPPEVHNSMLSYILNNLNQKPNPGYETNTLSAVANSPGVNAILGAGDAVRNLLSQGVIPDAKSGSGTAYNLGNIGGNIGAFTGGGELLDLARGASEGLPLIGKTASYLGQNGMIPSAARRMLGSGAFGAAEDKDNRLQGAEQGALLQGAFEAIPGGYNAVKSLYAHYDPQKMADQIANTLSKTGTNLEDVLPSLTDKIKSTYEKVRDKSASLYNNIFDSNRGLYSGASGRGKEAQEVDRIGDQKVYTPSGSLGTALTGQATEAPYSGLKDASQYFKNSNSYSNENLDALRNSYLKNRTFDSAHDLQSDLGDAIGKLQRQDQISGLVDADRNQLARYRSDRELLRQDIKNGLENIKPGMGDEYQSATDWHRDNVIPYENNAKLYDIASGNNKNTSNSTIKNIFSNPTLNKDTSTVVSHLSPDAKDQIAYLSMGVPSHEVNADNLLKARNDLEKSGLQSYLSSEINKAMDQMNVKNVGRNVLNRTATTAGGLGLGWLSGNPLLEALGAIGGAGMGKQVAPYIANSVKRYIPEGSFSGLTNKLKSLYPYANKATMGMLGKAQSQ